MLVTAGLILNCILFGCLMRPLEVNNESSNKVGCCLLLYSYNKYVKENGSNEEKKMLSLTTNGTVENGEVSLSSVILLYNPCYVDIGSIGDI